MCFNGESSRINSGPGGEGDGGSGGTGDGITQ